MTLTHYSVIHYLKLFWKPLTWLVIITVLCLLPPQDLPGKSLWRIPHFDKMVHFGMYFILAGLMARPVKTVRVPVWTVTLLTSVFVGGMIEILQFAVTSQRSASWGDFLADMAGAVVGLLLYGWLVAERRWERFI